MGSAINETNGQRMQWIMRQSHNVDLVTIYMWDPVCIMMMVVVMMGHEYHVVMDKLIH
jgi:hypothetical protein